ncbi:glutamine amidotransferase [Mesorhizobium sp. J428]|uniref:glutamine amidotransferase-related protein n=1 Tax=Mesorhizobium sp. J428 TaxID=2898440 RepID=UPI0021508386|nr:glutamine amidotransferase [Mesorhizobium sp. J428]MCR5858465.1 glutamine amidotransferase [Mesorhizobium sp. J428]
MTDPARKTAVAIRHVHFEDLGTFGPVLAEAGYGIRYCDVGIDDLAALDPLAPDLLVVLGAPVGVYEMDIYPFLAVERDLIARRLASGRPLLGVCLGGQQIAATMGAQVAPTGVKEIGFSPLTLSADGLRSPLRHLDGVQYCTGMATHSRFRTVVHTLPRHLSVRTRPFRAAAPCWRSSSIPKPMPRASNNG